MPPNNNKFDFQIVNDKHMTYLWALYAITEDGFEERLEGKSFAIREQYEDYLSKDVKMNNLPFKVTFSREKIQLDFVLLIQNTSDNIVKLTSKLLPDVPDE